MARRRGGLFLPLDVNFMDDELIALVGEKAGWLYLAMSLRAKSLLSDGVLTGTQIERLNIPGWKQRLDKLCSTLDRHGKSLVMDITEQVDVAGRYWITGWDGHNDRAETVKERRAQDAVRKRPIRTSSEPTKCGIRPVSALLVENSREEASTPLADPPTPIIDGATGLTAAKQAVARLRHSDDPAESA